MSYISMIQAVRQTIEPLLVEQGFVLIEAGTSDELAYLKYERAADGSGMTFHDDRDIAIHSGETRLFTWVNSLGSTLTTLKELLPNYLSIPLMERGWWTFRSEEELSGCIQEIREIIEGPLVDWLKNPVWNPAKVPLPPAAKLTPDDLRRWIESQQYWAERARNEGRLEDLGRIEQSLERMKKTLDEMLKSEGDSSV